MKKAARRRVAFFYALEVLANPKDKALGGIWCESIPVVNAEDGIEDAFVDKPESNPRINAKILTISKIPKVSPGITPRPSIHKEITL